MKTQFKEEQKFTQWWLWVILIGVGMIPIFGLYKQIVLGEKFGNNPMSDVGLVFFAFFVFSLLALFYFMRLKTEIDRNGIKMSFFPFVKKNVNWNDVKSAKVVNYGFVGGWGIRGSIKYGTVYTMKGAMGLAIDLKNGKKFLIGTQKEAEIEKVVVKFGEQQN